MKRAEHHLRSALKIDPKFYKAHFTLGLLLSERGEVKGAFDHFEKAISINSKYAEAHYHLAVLLMSESGQALGNAESSTPTTDKPVARSNKAKKTPSQK